MHEIPLEKYEFRTDLVIDDFSKDKKIKNYNKNIINDDIYVEEININKEEEKIFKRKEGLYKSITFKDITDKDNYTIVLDTFVNTLRKMLLENNIKKDESVLVIGLGNKKVTPDALGPKSISHILVTRHLFMLGDVEDGYRSVSTLEPGVTGDTGIETKDNIFAIVKETKPDFVIIIDAFKTTSIERLNKTIQISNTGISPGSGVNNSRSTISQDTIGVPVITIGVPTIIDSAVIVRDTINYMLKKFSYDKENFTKKKEKLKIRRDYTDYNIHLSDEEKKYLLGVVGLLDQEELNELIFEVLNPIEYNYMVTPKEIDFLIEKLSLLIGHSINKVLHNVDREYSDV